MVLLLLLLPLLLLLAVVVVARPRERAKSQLVLPTLLQRRRPLRPRCGSGRRPSGSASRSSEEMMEVVPREEFVGVLGGVAAAG